MRAVCLQIVVCGSESATACVGVRGQGADLQQKVLIINQELKHKNTPHVWQTGVEALS